MDEEIKKWLADIKIEDIPPISQSLAGAVGLEIFLKMTYAVGGTTIYIPKFDTVIQAAKYRRIKNEYNGYNYKDLALKYNLSESWVREIIQQDKLEKSQIKLFPNEMAVNQ